MMKREGVHGAASFILSFTLMIVCACADGGKKEAEEATTVGLFNSLGKNHHVAELLLVHCRQELMHGNEVVEDLDRNVPEVKASNGNDFVGRLLIESKTKKIHTSLLSKIDHFLLKCVRKKNLVFLLSLEDTVPQNWFTRYMDAISRRPHARRDLMQNFGGSPAPSPAGISPNAVPASSSPEIPPWPPSSAYGFGDPALQPSSGEESFSGSNLVDSQPNMQKSTGRAVFVAVVVTAAATFILLALLFLCCRKLFSGSRKGGNDNRPFLSLSPSDHSVASSQKSFTLSTSSSTEKPSSKVFDINSDHNIERGDLCLRSHSLGDSKIKDFVGTVAGADCKAANNFTPLISDTCGLPPLKPPPGRKILSVPTPGPGKTAPYPLVSPPPAPAPNPSNPPAAPSSPPPAPPLSKFSFGGPRPLAPGPPPVPLGSKTAPSPPPLNGGITPPRPPPVGLRPPRPSPIGSSNPSLSSKGEGDEADIPKAKLKPFFWDKVLANPEQSMVWHQIRSGSFQFSEEMIEALFGYAPTGKNKSQRKESSSEDPSNNYVQIIDPKKSQNLSILLKALNVTTEEVSNAIQEGNELPSELIHSLLKMAPTTDEELKLRLYSGDLSRLGPADRFLKVLVDIPFAFRRLEMLLFMCTLQEEEAAVKESFLILEAACMELRNSRLFLKLLEAVLKTGNRMNNGTFRGGAQAFKLDTLLKLSDVKGVDGKTTLLHFVVQEITRSEGVRAARAARENRSISSIRSDDLVADSSADAEDNYRSIGLQIVSGLDDELENVKRAAVLDADSVTGTVAKLGEALIKARGFLNSEMETVDEENGFIQALRSFVQNAEVDVTWMLEEDKRIMALVKSTGDYFHGKCGKDEGLRLFVIVRDFLIILERVCKEVKNSPRTPSRPLKKEEMKMMQSEQEQSPLPETRQRIIAAIRNRQMEESSSDDDSP